MLQSLLNGCKVLPQARCACYGLSNDRRLCLLQYADTQHRKGMLRRGTTRKGYATTRLNRGLRGLRGFTRIFFCCAFIHFCGVYS